MTRRLKRMQLNKEHSCMLCLHLLHSWIKKKQKNIALRIPWPGPLQWHHSSSVMHPVAYRTELQSWAWCHWHCAGGTVQSADTCTRTKISLVAGELQGHATKTHLQGNILRSSALGRCKTLITQRCMLNLMKQISAPSVLCWIFYTWYLPRF